MHPTRIRGIVMALVHCRECGEMISESAPICPKCGASQSISSVGTVCENKGTDIDLSTISALCPFVGLMLYIAYKRENPKLSNVCGKWALIGIPISVLLSFIYLYIFIGLLLEY